MGQERQLQSAMLDGLLGDVMRQTDLHVLAGMLFLERGRPKDAETSFRKGLALSRLGLDTRHASAVRPLAEVYHPGKAARLATLRRSVAGNDASAKRR